MNFEGKTDLIKQVQSALGGLLVDGVDGKETWTAIHKALVKPTVLMPDDAADNTPSEQTQPLLSPRSMKLILDYEVGGGESYYNKALKKPCYPGGASGVTIGIGYDLGYNSLSQFTADWGLYLDPNTFQRLSATLGKKSSAAKAAVSSVSDIVIPWDAALKVFANNTVPRFINETLKAFPGADKLHPDAFGVLVSLVFNRGGSVSGPTRTEMLNIRNAILNKPVNSDLYQYIADQIISMKRLWVGRGLDGLLRRRNEEAAIIKNIQ